MSQSLKKNSWIPLKNLNLNCFQSYEVSKWFVIVLKRVKLNPKCLSMFQTCLKGFRIKKHWEKELLAVFMHIAQTGKPV